MPQLRFRGGQNGNSTSTMDQDNLNEGTAYDMQEMSLMNKVQEFSVRISPRHEMTASDLPLKIARIWNHCAHLLRPHHQRFLAIFFFQSQSASE